MQELKHNIKDIMSCYFDKESETAKRVRINGCG